jgi:DNA-binding LacI/PurR family transcriptional regulator/DNA-binding transcriptional regulator YhcF (GntR family)
MPTSAPETGRLPSYQRIAASLRQDIVDGKYAPGSLLPSTERFATTLSSSYFTVHTALKTLVKEGWIERLHGHGTYVAMPEKRFLHAAIFHSLNIFSNEETTFVRCLNECLVEKFRAMGKTTQVLIDTRPEPEQNTVFPPLAQAIQHRQIHCLIAPNPNSRSARPLLGLPIPVAAMSSGGSTGVNFDHQGFVQNAVKKLKEQGCRTIGFINSSLPVDDDFTLFIREVQGAGLRTQRDWTIQPQTYAEHLIDYGYDTFRKIARGPELPEGLIVTPDTAMRGVITGILQAGVRVPEKMKIVSHRNARARLLCPFPVTWAVTDENAAAEALIATIQRQFAGEKPTHVSLPYTFQDDDAARWLA